MPNTVVIGKDLPDGLDFVKAIAGIDRTVFTCMKTEADTVNFESQNIFGSTWNKGSAVSAYSFFIKAETKLQKINEVIFYFDTSYFCSKFDSERTDEIAAGLDSMVNAYLYASGELLKRLEQTREKTVVTFLLREYPSKHEMLLAKTPGGAPASTIVSAAQAAFISLAESFSTNVTEKNYLSVILARCNQANELYKSEYSIAKWVSESMDAIASQKNVQTLKQATTWNKVGSKLQGGFTLFSR
ncbi:MAG: hypothetical protein J6J00_12185 [Treponema sp.]|nr:hypothetical protein [Treponema sp.]